MTLRTLISVVLPLIVLSLPVAVVLLPGGAQAGPKAGRHGTATKARHAHGRVDLKGATARARQALLAKHGAGERQRIDRGLHQVAMLWERRDGSPQAFEKFVVKHFVPSGAKLSETLGRFEEALEQLDGHHLEIARSLRRRTDLDVGPLLEVDKILAGMEPGAHLVEDFFQSKLAFVALLNFPLTTLKERLQKGKSWSREQWAAARLAQRFYSRVPGSIKQRITEAGARSEIYISEYNIYMHHVVDKLGLDGKSRPFPRGLRLITHWNLRDEIKARYGKPGALRRQRLVARVMQHIAEQTIPQVVIDNPTVDWNPLTNQVVKAPPATIERAGAKPPVRLDAKREPDTRFARLLGCYHAARAADPYSPMAPSLIARRFDVERELPEARVERLLKQVVGSPLIRRIGKIIEARLGRPLEPFDIWYDGFQSRSEMPAGKLDRMVRRRYPKVAAFQKDLARLLRKLGFRPKQASFLADHIVVDASRGAGHAMEAMRRQDKPHLRTRVPKEGMNYKGFNIATHELGHNVEQVYSLYGVDRTLLQGVPNTAFTEAIAFVFQHRDLELLGLGRPSAERERLRVLNTLWMTYEIAGVALVDMAVWHWMYQHPQATPAQLRAATLKIARDVWNRYYAPVFGQKDVTILAVYSHMISYFLYLPDYPIGHLIAFQIEEHLKKKGIRHFGPEVERMTKLGRVTPDLWMRHATGEPVSAKPLLQATARAVAVVERELAAKARTGRATGRALKTLKSPTKATALKTLKGRARVRAKAGPSKKSGSRATGTR